ncbi:MAG: hypothetical protein JXN64_03185 [Spirochaetes bacterium]|nr:hypothetical protein [Spirochaetota bacterium]
MIINGFDEKMNSEINARMQSPDWDLNIASKVIERRNKKIKRNFYALSSFSLLATAAVVVIAVFINTTPVKMNDVEIFISKQVEETHKIVFKEKYSNNMMTVSYTEDSNDPIDNLILTALTRR